jgi:hypothetical protein
MAIGVLYELPFEVNNASHPCIKTRKDWKFFQKVILEENLPPEIEALSDLLQPALQDSQFVSKKAPSPLLLSGLAPKIYVHFNWPTL